MSDMIETGALLCVLTFLFTVMAETLLVPWLRARRAGQPILEIGPSWHLSKAGTPTLGGLGFIFAICVSCGVFAWLCSVWGTREHGRFLLLVCFALCCGAIGFFDDWCKLRRKQNKGLSAWQKYLLQLIVCVAFLLLTECFFGLPKTIDLPFLSRDFQIGTWYYPFAVLYLTGLVNALNLTDGVDGLLSATVGVFSLFPLLFGVFVAQWFSLVTGAILLGAVLGFLCFNRHPAKVFMGDTGSLFLGAMVGGYGVLCSLPIAVLIGCGVFVTEAFSVILQVVYFKCTKGKRLFRMAPLHHHFEKKGWSEWRVVGVFSLVGTLFALLAWWGSV